MMSLDCLDSVKDNEWPGGVDVKEAEKRDIYYYLSLYFNHTDFSAIMNHSCPGNFAGLKC